MSFVEGNLVVDNNFGYSALRQLINNQFGYFLVKENSLWIMILGLLLCAGS